MGVPFFPNMHASDFQRNVANPYMSDEAYADAVEKAVDDIASRMPPTPTFEPFSVGADP